MIECGECEKVSSLDSMCSEHGMCYVCCDPIEDEVCI